jgi:hypothetical protein
MHQGCDCAAGVARPDVPAVGQRRQRKGSERTDDRAHSLQRLTNFMLASRWTGTPGYPVTGLTRKRSRRRHPTAPASLTPAEARRQCEDVVQVRAFGGGPDSPHKIPSAFDT